LIFIKEFVIGHTRRRLDSSPLRPAWSTLSVFSVS
jgi:hypothetical protein